MNMVIVALREAGVAASEPRIQQAMTCVRPDDWIVHLSTKYRVRGVEPDRTHDVTAEFLRGSA
jgi:hypothetical protein